MIFCKYVLHKEGVDGTALVAWHSDNNCCCICIASITVYKPKTFSVVF